MGGGSRKCRPWSMWLIISQAASGVKSNSTFVGISFPSHIRTTLDGFVQKPRTTQIFLRQSPSFHLRTVASGSPLTSSPPDPVTNNFLHGVAVRQCVFGNILE